MDSIAAKSKGQRPPGSAPSSASFPESAWDRDAKTVGRLPMVMGAGLLAVVGFVGFAAIGGAQAEPAEQNPADTSVTDRAPETPPDRPRPEAIAAADEDDDPPGDPGGAILAAGVDPAKLGTSPEAEAPATAVHVPATNPPPKAKQSKAQRAAAHSGGASRPAKRSEPPVLAEPAPDPAAKIDSALKAGWMRESGSLLLVFPNNTPTAWADAKSLCQRRRDAGLTAWRLARVSELEKLRAARDLPAGTWWSSTATDDGTKAFTLAPAKKSEVSKEEGKALPVCVHTRPGV